MSKKGDIQLSIYRFSLENKMSVDQTSNTNETSRLATFVESAPQYNYNIDQYKQRICRQLPGGQEECVKLNLEGKKNAKVVYQKGAGWLNCFRRKIVTRMFSEMQKLGFFCALPMDPTQTHIECTRV